MTGTERYCPECGGILDIGLDFCPACGRRITEGYVDEEGYVTDEPPPSQESAPAPGMLMIMDRRGVRTALGRMISVWAFIAALTGVAGLIYQPVAEHLGSGDSLFYRSYMTDLILCFVSSGCAAGAALLTVRGKLFPLAFVLCLTAAFTSLWVMGTLIGTFTLMAGVWISFVMYRARKVFG